MKFLSILGILCLLTSCNPSEKLEPPVDTASADIMLTVLGTVQDGGSPHISCQKECCKDLFDEPDPERKVVCLGLIDKENKKNWLFEATPDIATQMKKLQKLSPFEHDETPNGIFLTHAHIGHYTGLMQLGREVMNASGVEVFTMPKMQHFLESNGPWNQLVELKNIELKPLRHGRVLELSGSLRVVPFLVPHRDEYSETVGYLIEGPSRKALFIPDIDKWNKWEKDILTELTKVDYAFLDASFYNGEEIANRDISEIPHPFIVESISLMQDLPREQKEKIHFIHFNHTNPALNANSPESVLIESKGFNIAKIDQIFEL